MKHHGTEDLRDRTKAFALRIVRLSASLPKTREADVIGRQLLRCGTSVGANYRAARRARSDAEFRAKLGIVEEEADESAYWLELLIDAKIVPAERLKSLYQEADQLTAIIVSALKTAKSRTRSR